MFANRETLASDYLDGVPETVRPFFSSVYEAEASILSGNGFGVALMSGTGGSATATGMGLSAGEEVRATSSSTAGAAGARETGLGGMGRAAVVGAVGFVGVVMAL